MSEHSGHVLTLHVQWELQAHSEPRRTVVLLQCTCGSQWILADVTGHELEPGVYPISRKRK